MRQPKSPVRRGRARGHATPRMAAASIGKSPLARRSIRRWSRAGVTVLLGAVGVAALSAGAGAATSSRSPGGTASGSVAAISGTSMEVQSPSAGQTTVNWTSSTNFSQTLTEAETAVAVGQCVTVTGTPAKSSKTSITARSISIRQPSTSGTCSTGTGGTFGRGGFSGAGGPPERAGGFPGGGSRPPGGFPGRGGSRGRGSFPGGNLAIANGKVTAVSGSTVSVSGTLRSGFGRPTKSTKKPAAPKTQALTVTMSKTTTLTETQAASSSALGIGDCVNAFGQTGSTGAVTAARVSITSTGGKTCSTGFGPGGFGGA